MGAIRLACLIAASWAAAPLGAGVASAEATGDIFSRMHVAEEEALTLRRVSALSSSREEDRSWTGASMSRQLLQSRVQNAPRCPRCRFRGNRGNCRLNRKVFVCRRSGASTGFVRRGAPNQIAESVLGAGTCPNLVQPPPEFVGPGGGTYGAGDEDGDDVEYDYEGDDIVVEGEDVFGTVPEFAEVETAEELQAALRAGANHILITAHFDGTGATPERDLAMREALDNALGRVENTTLSIAGQCDGEPPPHFNLTEPRPPGACAILVRQDFLDAPLGTNCLLLDSLYIALATQESAPESDDPRRRDSSSSVMLLHVDGLIWVNNCVFQGSGGNTRAIDTNTINGGRPELYIRNTTFTTFRRTLGPGIRVLAGAKLWLDNVTFRNIVQPRLPAGRAGAGVPQASAIAASENVLLVLVNVTIEDNEVLGEPAGVRAIAISPNGTAVYAAERFEVWQWPNGPETLTEENTAVAPDQVQRSGRPQLELIKSVQQQFAERGLAGMIGGDDEF